MYSILTPLKTYFSLGHISITDWVFKLHYKLTFVLLLAFSVIVITKQFFGERISCNPSAKDEVPKDVLNNYCWIHSTFTLPKAYDKPVGWEVAYPGVDKATDADETTYHAYYQWVCFFLTLQAIMFYTPAFLWELWEDKITERLIKDPHNLVLLPKKEQLVKKITRLNKGAAQDGPVEFQSVEEAKYIEDLTDSHPYGANNKLILQWASYLYQIQDVRNYNAIIYFLCELLNLANVIGQMYFTNTFLGGEFTTYGLRVMNFTVTDQSDRTDPMVEVFPLITKCTFRRVGPAGSIQNHDALCVLPVNVINEKIFIALWFWYVILAILSGIQVLVRLPLITKWCQRKVLGVGTTPETKECIPNIVDPPYTSFDFWFQLRLLKMNLPKVTFQALVWRLNKKITDSQNSTYVSNPEKQRLIEVKA